MRTIKHIAAALLLAGSAGAANAALYDGSFQVGYDGEVLATFLGHTASYSDDLFFSTDKENWQFIFNNHSSPIGEPVSLGNFTAGTELFFKIYVHNTGDTFYSGPASNNYDGWVHLTADTFGDVTYVGFEDLAYGGDQDFDDLVYSFENVAAVPEPETYALLAAGLGAVAFARRKQRK